MNIQELLENAFIAGKLFQIDQMTNCSGNSNNPDFEEWLEENKNQVETVLQEKYQIGYEDGYCDHKNLD